VNPDERIAVSRVRAMELVDVSRDTLLKALRTGDLVEHYVTSKPLILVDDLRAWVTSAPTSPRGPR
jgi:hypothetical protein